MKNHLQKMEVNPFNSGPTLPNPKRQRYHENGPIKPAKELLANRGHNFPTVGLDPKPSFRNPQPPGSQGKKHPRKKYPRLPVHAETHRLTQQRPERHRLFQPINQPIDYQSRDTGRIQVHL